jgi:hypothetical protein
MKESLKIVGNPTVYSFARRASEKFSDSPKQNAPCRNNGKGHADWVAGCYSL